ncbi:hypothetical protein ACLVWU_08375 [Bdellovibrio sp. HCB290]|uniref:hypothetical protein n=1 Tax=Bdellovibrio sp. HCB290 TaxID=3394356 RepID=UPI0039B54E70
MMKPAKILSMGRFEVFKEISIGGLTKEELIQQLVSKGIQFNKYANILFEDSAFTPTTVAERIMLVKVNLHDLNLTKPTIYEDIVSAAEDLGLKLCPLIVAAHLRLEYLEQPEGPYLKVASPKVGNEDSYPRGLYLRNNDNALWLRGFCASDDWEYQLDMEFIFQQ